MCDLDETHMSTIDIPSHCDASYTNTDLCKKAGNCSTCLFQGQEGYTCASDDNVCTGGESCGSLNVACDPQDPSCDFKTDCSYCFTCQCPCHEKVCESQPGVPYHDGGGKQIPEGSCACYQGGISCVPRTDVSGDWCADYEDNICMCSSGTNPCHSEDKNKW